MLEELKAELQASLQKVIEKWWEKQSMEQNLPLVGNDTIAYFAKQVVISIAILDEA